jgi:hypothetical protein
MAKRRKRRTSQTKDDGRSTAESLADTARDMSVNAVKAVKAATETAKAALSGMQELGRTVADMAAPAAKRSVKMANEVTRVALDTTRELARTAGKIASDAIPSAASTPRRTAGSGAKRRKSGRRGPA